MKFRLSLSSPSLFCLGLFCLSLLQASSLSAATMGELLDAALARNPAATQWQAQAGQIDANAEAAARWFPAEPELSVAGRGDQWHDQNGQREWEVEMSAPLWRPGQRQRQMQAADSARVRWQAEQLALKLLLAGQLREALWDVQESDVRAQQAQQRIAIADQLEKDVARRVAAGELARADSLLAQGDALAARSQADTAQQEQLAAHIRLRLLTGQDTLPAPLEEIPAIGAADTAASHPRVLSAQQEATHARSAEQLAQTPAVAPSAALIWKQERDSFDEDYAQTVGMKLTLPLGADGRNRPAIAAAQAELSSAEARLQQTQREVEQDIALAQAALMLAERQRTQAEQQSELAQQTFALARRAFDAGELDLLSLLKLQGNALDASENRTLKTIAHQRAIARFNQAIGVLP